MSVEENKAIVRRVHEAVSRHDLDAAGRDMAPGYAEWQADQPMLRQLFVAFPDCRWDIDDVVADGDKVVVRDAFWGTHRGAFMGVPPTGTAVTMGSIHIFRLAEGKIVEHWNQADQLGMMGQLGASPTPQAAG